MIAPWLLAVFAAPPVLAPNHGFPHGEDWTGRAYGEESTWVSAHVATGVALLVTNENIKSGAQAVPSITAGGLFHLGHRFAIPLEVAFRVRTFADEGDWEDYVFNQYVFGTGLRYAVIAAEAFELAVAGRVGVGISRESVVYAGKPRARLAWTTPQLATTGRVELQVFPTHQIEIALLLGLDAFFGKDDAFRPPSSASPVQVASRRMGPEFSLRVGWHF